MNIKDIAKQAGVSTATVSRALNNPEKVKKDTLERVMRIIDDNQYSLNPFARNLASPGRTNNIVMIIPNLVNPFFFELVKGAESVFTEYGYYLHAHNVNQHLNDPDQLFKVIDDLGNEGFFDGMIVAGTLFMNSHFIPGIPNLTKPMVCINPNPDIKELDSVLVDERTGIWLTFEHLKKRGYTDIGIIHGGHHIEITRHKLKYIRELLSDFDLNLKDEWIYESSFDTIDESYRLMTNLLQSGQKLPRVFLCINDLIAIGISRAILDKGYRIPKDFAIIGSDDISFSKYFSPSLTSIKVPTEDLGKTAARILLNKISNPNLPPQRIYLPPTLIVRESC
ncbi:LacI family DNA-binding transcriptional regulator [Clostridia bacterium]|nr:LacI family DNA-binding transcriptional regulator [Clostridia bacterium]